MDLHLLRGRLWRILCPPSGALRNIQRGCSLIIKSPDARINLSSVAHQITFGAIDASSQRFTWYGYQSQGINLVALCYSECVILSLVFCYIYFLCRIDSPTSPKLYMCLYSYICAYYACVWIDKFVYVIKSIIGCTLTRNIRFEEQCLLNESTGFSWGLNSMSLKCSYEFIIRNLSLEW